MFAMNKFTDDQVEQIIDFVQARPALYDKRDPDYKRKEWKNHYWSEIATLLSSNEKDCKAAWRCLKDQFVRRLKEFRGKSGYAAERMLKKYKHFERLLFLRNPIEFKLFGNNYEEVIASKTIKVEELILSDTSSLEYVSVPEMSPVSIDNEYTCSAKRRKISWQPEADIDFETSASSSFLTPKPEDAPSENNKVEDSNCDSSNLSKTEFNNITKGLSNCLDKLTSTVEELESNNLEIFFKSIAKSANRFNLTDIEQSTLMMGVSELLHKIVVNRQK